MTQDTDSPMSRPSGTADALRRAITSPWMPLGLALLAMALASPSLGIGWLMDDYYHKLVLRGSKYMQESVAIR